MTINISILNNFGFLPDMMLLALYYYHRGTRLNVIKRLAVAAFDPPYELF